MNKVAVAVFITATLLLSACGAQPANLPTVTPILPTSLPTLTVTSTPQPAAEAVPPEAAVPDRPFAMLSTQERSRVASSAPAITIDVTLKYVATIRTSKGEIKVELDPSSAPATVNNFVFLSQNGFYDGLTFHRVEPGFVIQGGDPAGTGAGGPGYNLPPEIKLPHTDGAIAMARQGGPPETTPSSGSQFYITLGAQPGLDNQYTVFGQTTAGMDVVQKIAVGDIIERVDITTAEGTGVTPAPVASQPTPVCSVNPINAVPDDHSRGAADASVIIIEYADMQCPACAQIAPSVNAVFQQISDTVRIIFRHFPLNTIHDKAQITSQALEAASMQGKFWEYHDLLYEKQGEWSGIAVADVNAILKTYAQDLGLDASQFEADLSSDQVVARVNRDTASAELLQLSGTPTMFLNGRPIDPSAFLQENITQLIMEYAVQRKAVLAAAGNAKHSFSSPEQVTEEGASYVLTVKTSKGNIALRLDPKLAPVNVNSTVFLAQKGYYDGVPIDQSVTDLGLVLFGDATLEQNPGYTCGMEMPAAGSFGKGGVVALLNLGQNNLSQLIVTYSATQQLESQFTVIGEVISGLDVAQLLRAAEGTMPADQIISVTVSKQ